MNIKNNPLGTIYDMISATTVKLFPNKNKNKEYLDNEAAMLKTATMMNSSTMSSLNLASNAGSNSASNVAGGVYTTQLTTPTWSTTLGAGYDWDDLTIGNFNGHNVEIELTDGRKTILNITFNKIRNMFEVTDGDGTHVEFEYPDAKNNNTYSKYSVNCNLRQFMKLIDVKYTSWADTIMKEVLENG